MEGTMPAAPLEPTLPGTAYTTAESFALEKERIFSREWFCVGREEEVRNSGDYLHLDIAGESVLLVRTRQGELSAFYNVCRHRGCRLQLGYEAKPGAEKATTSGPSGTFPGVIRCPYHSWTYELDGRLRSAPFLNDQIDKADFSLFPIGVETWGGFVFLNLTPHEARERGYDLRTQLGPFTLEYLQNYPLDQLRTVGRLVYDVHANWKVIMENYNECYHCGPVHPELCEIVPLFKKNGGADLPWEDGIPQKEGTFTYTFSGVSNRPPMPGLSEAEQVKHKGALIYPNMMFSLSADHGAAFTLWPHGPDHTTIICDFLIHPNAIERPDFDPSDVIEFWDVVNKQDWGICEGVQQGMASRAFSRGYYAPMEDGSKDIRQYIGKHIGKM